MKKNINSLCFAVIVLLGAASCTQVLPEMAIDKSTQAVAISPVASVTKAGPIDGTVFPNSYNMVVSAYYNAAEGASGNYFSGITFSRNASTGRWDESKYWPMSGTLNILAYSANDGTNNVVTAAPVYSAKNTDGVTLTVTDNRTAQVDILHSQVEEQTYSASGVPMQFKHAQAAIAFVAKSNVAYHAASNVGITITKITLNDAKYSGTLAISKTEAAGSTPADGYCVWSSLGSEADKDLPGLSSYDVPASYIDITYAGNHFGIGNTGIMVPEQTQTSFTIYYTLHNGKASDGTTNLDNALQYTHTLSGDWIEGKKYVYELNFTLNKIEITPVVVDWNVESEEVEIPAPADPANGHAYVDLGLRRTIGGVEYKVLFADRNIGASSPEDYGDYFQWGDTQVRYSDIDAYEPGNGDFIYDWSNCIWHTGSSMSAGFTKYVPSEKTSYWSGSGTPDNLLTLEASDDVASVLWGGDWRMPDSEEQQLLIDDSVVNVEFVYDYNSTGVNGLLITGKGDFASASVFLPAAGCLLDSGNFCTGYNGDYWSRSLGADYPGMAGYLYFEDGIWEAADFDRCFGLPVRAVRLEAVEGGGK